MATNQWEQPQEVDDVTLAFPADIKHLMPPYGSVKPERRWITFQQTWFFKGLTGATLIPKPGIDLKKALRHLAAIQNSFEPKHEHKEQAVAYLASRWLDEKSTW